MKDKVKDTLIAVATFKASPRGSVSSVIGSVMLTVLFGAVFVSGLNHSTTGGTLFFGGLTVLFGYGLYKDLARSAANHKGARND